MDLLFVGNSKDTLHQFGGKESTVVQTDPVLVNKGVNTTDKPSVNPSLVSCSSFSKDIDFSKRKRKCVKARVDRVSMVLGFDVGLERLKHCLPEHWSVSSWGWW